MSEMIERVANVMWAKRLLLREPEEFVVLARAAIEAMREPTEAQLLTVADSRNEAQRKCFADDWREMIDAALAD